MPTRVELLLAHLDRLSGGVEPRLFPLRSTHPGMPGVTVIVYEDLPAFAIFAPAVLERPDYAGIDVGDALPVNIAGLYPIHESERRYLHAHGLKAFWDLDWDPYDTNRPPAA
jgi:hypothetical protein